MKYSPKNYAVAFVEKLEELSPTEIDILIKNFVAKIIHYGDFISIQKIKRAIELELLKKNQGKLIEVEFAREIDESQIKKLNSVFSKEDLVEIKINKELVAGTRITIDGKKELDNSLRGKLNKIFS